MGDYSLWGSGFGAAKDISDLFDAAARGEDQGTQIQILRPAQAMSLDPELFDPAGRGRRLYGMEAFDPIAKASEGHQPCLRPRCRPPRAGRGSDPSVQSPARRGREYEPQATHSINSSNEVPGRPSSAASAATAPMSR